MFKITNIEYFIFNNSKRSSSNTRYFDFNLIFLALRGAVVAKLVILGIPFLTSFILVL